MNWKWEIAKADHIGGREEQQDSVTTFSTPNGEIHLLVIADGMGGHKGGRLASQIVVQSARSMWNKFQQGQTVSSPRQFLQKICILAHRNINQLGEKYGLSPHSTCVLLYINGKQAWWAHLGDSRLYHFRGSKLLQRTKDHSVVQLLVDLGRISETEMAKHPDQGRLLKGLGGEEPFKPELGQASVRPGDSFLLCSDGFWEQVSPPNMLKRLLQKHFSLEKRVKRLVKDAWKTGGETGDNIAVAVAQIKGKSLSNIMSYIVLGIIIVALLLGGGVWYYLKPVVLKSVEGN